MMRGELKGRAQEPDTPKKQAMGLKRTKSADKVR